MDAILVDLALSVMKMDKNQDTSDLKKMSMEYLKAVLAKGIKDEQKEV